MKEQNGKKQAFVPVLGNAFLILFGLAIAMGLAEMLIRAFPNWVPAEVRVNPPVRRAQAFMNESYDVKQSNGDLYYWMRGAIVPLSPDQDKVVTQVHLTTDAHGFRNPLPEQVTYGIVALGDSFTVGGNVATPWPQTLAEYTGINVLNLGEAGFGPQEELVVLQQYGLEKRPRWVIMAYFGGNDLYDAAAYQQANPFILPRFARYMLGWSIDTWQARSWNGAHAEVAPSYRYPIIVTINNKDLELAFFSSYISWLSVGREEIESSQNYRITRETILQIRKLTETADAKFLLVYLPTKAHVYLPFLNDTETLARVFTDIPVIEPDEEGFLQFTDKTATLELTRQHMNDQANLLASFAAEQDINYLDLTPYFQKEASAGVELYYPFDTHWNQSGHDLAAQTIAEYIENLLMVSATE